MPALEFPYRVDARAKPRPSLHPVAERCVVASLVVISVLLVAAVLLDAAGLWILI